MRVAVIHNTRPTVILGDRIRIEAILQLIQSNGHEVLDVCIPSTHSVRHLCSNILPLSKSVMLKPHFSRKYVSDEIGFVTSLNYLTRLLRRLNPDIVVAETTKVGWITSIAAKKLSLKCIIDLHGLGFAEAIGKKRKNWQQILRIEKEACQNCDHIVTVSSIMKEYLKKEFEICDEKISVAPNGGQLQRLTARYAKPLKIIFAGSFVYWEKVDDVLNLAQNADEKIFKFFLAGAGPLKLDLLAKIKERRIPITYLGYVPRERIFDLFSRMQVGLAPSTRDLARQVASPIKIFDYMSCGLPVIASRVGDWGEIIRNEDCGLALENDTTEEYLKALDTFAAEDKWTRMSRNAITAVRERHSWNQCLKPLMDSIIMLERDSS